MKVFQVLDLTTGERLPGYKKESFPLPYHGGEIWFEHLDGMYGYEELVLRKLANDAPLFTRPSSPSFICFVFDETVVTDWILDAVTHSVLDCGKRFLKIAFVGLDRKSIGVLRKALSKKGFSMAFLRGLEDAKAWLLP